MEFRTRSTGIDRPCNMGGLPTGVARAQVRHQADIISSPMRWTGDLSRGPPIIDGGATPIEARRDSNPSESAAPPRTGDGGRQRLARFGAAPSDSAKGPLINALSLIRGRLEQFPVFQKRSAVSLLRSTAATTILGDSALSPPVSRAPGIAECSLDSDRSCPSTRTNLKPQQFITN